MLAEGICPLVAAAQGESSGGQEQNMEKESCWKRLEGGFLRYLCTTVEIQRAHLGWRVCCCWWEHSFLFKYLWEQTSLLWEWAPLMFWGGWSGGVLETRVFTCTPGFRPESSQSSGLVWVYQLNAGPAWTLQGYQKGHFLFYLLASCAFNLRENCSVSVRERTGKPKTSSGNVYEKPCGGVDLPVFLCYIRAICADLSY